MKLKMTLAKLISLCLFFAMASCGGGPDDTPNNRPTEFLILSYKISAVQYQQAIDENYTVDANGDVERRIGSPIASAEVVDWFRFSLQITSTAQRYQASRQRLPTFSLFSQAIATSPARPIAKQNLTAISVTSDNAYTDAYPAGTELSGLLGLIANPFYELEHMLNPQSVMVSIPSYIKTLADFSGQGLDAPGYLKVKLVVAPQYSRQNFAVKITLDDGSVFNLQSGDIYFSVPNP